MISSYEDIDFDVLYTTNGKDAWRVLYCCEFPTVTLQNIETNEKIGGAIGSLNVRPFRKLVSEDD